MDSASSSDLVIIMIAPPQCPPFVKCEVNGTPRPRTSGTHGTLVIMHIDNVIMPLNLARLKMYKLSLIYVPLTQANKRTFCIFFYIFVPVLSCSIISAYAMTALRRITGPNPAMR